eukprot:scaffold1231_cov79-Isochrysis_galbana.AAC.1
MKASSTRPLRGPSKCPFSCKDEGGLHASWTWPMLEPCPSPFSCTGGRGPTPAARRRGDRAGFRPPPSPSTPQPLTVPAPPAPVTPPVAPVPRS